MAISIVTINKLIHFKISVKYVQSLLRRITENHACEGDERTLYRPSILASMTIYPFATCYNLIVDTKHTSFFETAIVNYSGGYFMNKANDCLMIGSYIFGLNSEFLFI